ncbi:hypothetical protein TNCV_275831 [Trichonephila clavipes]|nr:hypothetical protein TNCV_275831 [Trichonephila clavipes]
MLQKGTACTVLAGNETFGFHPFEPPSETGDPALLPKAHNGLDIGEIKLSPDEMILKYRKIVRNEDMIDDCFAPNVKTCIACEHPDPVFRMVNHRHILATFRDTNLHVLIVKRCRQAKTFKFSPTSP